MKEIHTEIIINASAERVWRLLTDFAKYPEWNPFVRSISGKPEPQTKLKIFVQPPGGRGMSFNPTVLRAEPNKELRWLGSLFIRGLFDGEHSFVIEQMAQDKVRFVHSEKFSGVLVPLLGGTLGSAQLGFEEMNKALKKEAEKKEAE